MLIDTSLMRKIAKEPFILVQALSIIILISSMLLLLFYWQFFYGVDAQDDGGREDADTGDTNNRNDDIDKSFSIIIPENAAWSESIDQRFYPSNIIIPVGTEVTWINEDRSQHTVTSENLTNQGRDGIYDSRFYSGILGSEDSFSYTFNEPGIYSYFCSPHPWMTGSVIVDEQDANIQVDDEEDSTGDEEEQTEDEEDEEDEE
jgi:plastocyanin